MTDFIESIGLHAEGFSDEQIAQINAELPDAQALIALAPTLLSAIGVTSMAPKAMMMVRPAAMTPAMARGVLAAV